MKKILEVYIERLSYGKSMVLKPGHYVHYESSLENADEVIFFISTR